MGEEFLRWQVRDREEYLAFRQYIQKNPVKSALTHTQEEYRYSSSGSSVALDGVPQRLKPPGLIAQIAAVNRCATQKRVTAGIFAL